MPRRTSQQSKGPGTAPSDFCRKRSCAPRSSSFVRDEAADHVGVAAEVLGRRVDDEVGSERERLLQVGRGEGVVDDEEGADGVRSVGGAADVDDVQERVRRRLDPDEPHLLVEMRRQVLVELVGRDVGEAVSLRLVDLRGHPVDAPVDVGDQDDPLARVDEMEQRRRRPEARGERDAVRRLPRGSRAPSRAPRGSGSRRASSRSPC